MRPCGKRVKALSLDLLCDWPQREPPTPTQLQSRRVYCESLTRVIQKVIEGAPLLPALR